jgi:outer membrane receptor protein involved in Fe transport
MGATRATREPAGTKVKTDLFRAFARFVGSSLLFTVQLSAQQLATLNVTVTDPSGSVISQARVTLRNIETDGKRTDLSSVTGVAVIPGLPAGRYQLIVESSQFSPYQASLSLTVGQNASLPVTLGLKTVREDVEVQETAQGVDPQKSEVSQVIDTQKIADLPISGRDFIDFVLLTPSVNVGRSTAVGAQSPFQETVLQLSFAGLRETHSAFFGLDGTDYSISISGVQRASPSQDWVREFRVATSPSTVDNGRNLGAVVNTVTKSGRNDVHGSVYEFFRNNKLDSNNLLSAPGFNTLRFNQFGGNLGGPIRREKNFFFLGYEGQRRAESPLYSSFILHCTDNPGCLGPDTPSINQVKRSLGLQPEDLGSILQIGDYDKFFGKLTNVLSDKSTLNIGYLFNGDRKQHIPGAAPGQGLPSFYRNNPIRDQTVYANLLHVFGSHWTSESMLNFGRRTFHLDPVGAGFEPTILVADLFSSGGIQGGVHYYREQHFQAAENLTYVRGNHSFKFGAEFEPVWILAQTTFFTPGAGIFTPQSFFGAAPFDAPPFGAGTPVEFLFLQPRSFFGQQIPPRTLPFQTGLFAGPAAAEFTDSTNLKFLHKLSGFYAQDQWKVRPNLTLTLGLRYDVDFFLSATDIRLNGKMHPTNYGNVQPRVGLAYAVRQGKGVVRAAFGLFTGPFDYSDIMVSWQGASAFTNMKQPILPEFVDPSNDLVGLGPSGIVGVSGPFLASRAFANLAHNGAYPDPATLLQFPLGYVKRKFPNPYAEETSLEVENEVAKNLFVSIGYQFVHGLKLPVYKSVNGVPNGTVPTGVQSFAPADPNFGFALEATPTAYSIYHAGTLSVRKLFAQHYSILANYTYSKSIDIATDIQLTDTPMDYLHPSRDRSLGDNDVRHRLVLTLMGESSNTWNPVLRNFKVSMLDTLQSPRYYTVLAGFDVNGDQYPFSDRVGNIGRNTYRGDPSYTTDVRVQRGFKLTERLKAEASAEVFNLFNRQNVNAIDSVYGAPAFLGPIPKKFGDGVNSPANPTFGAASFVAAARQIQFAVRLNF